ncbi:hypothetical protein [Neptuniibacter marinus]|uniref:hypothetical protein n=1 Tax=Neptuniibacter marinus TaxID=1806670 RepID=UPI003B5AC1B8
MTIKKLIIENIKGFSSQSFELNIIPNKPSLLVAPNGFGKSSLAAAFLSLKQKKQSKLFPNWCLRNLGGCRGKSTNYF